MSNIGWPAAREPNNPAHVFYMYGIAGNPNGEWELVENKREWTANGSRSLSDRFMGTVYGNGKKGWQKANAALSTMNKDIKRPATCPADH